MFDLLPVELTSCQVSLLLLFMLLVHKPHPFHLGVVSCGFLGLPVSSSLFVEPPAFSFSLLMSTVLLLTMPLVVLVLLTLICRHRALLQLVLCPSPLRVPVPQPGHLACFFLVIGLHNVVSASPVTLGHRCLYLPSRAPVGCWHWCWRWTRCRCWRWLWLSLGIEISLDDFVFWFLGGAAAGHSCRLIGCLGELTSLLWGPGVD